MCGHLDFLLVPVPDIPEVIHAMVPSGADGVCGESYNHTVTLMNPYKTNTLPYLTEQLCTFTPCTKLNKSQFTLTIAKTVG